MTDRHFDPEELLHSIVELEHRLVCMETKLESDNPSKDAVQSDIGSCQSSDLAKAQFLQGSFQANQDLVQNLLTTLKQAKASLLDINDLHDYYQDNHIDKLYSGEYSSFYHNKKDRRIVIIIVVFMLYIVFSLFMMIR